MIPMFHKQLFIPAIFCLWTILSFGQRDMGFSESLAKLSDSLLKSEIASFTSKGASFKPADPPSKVGLTELSISHCTDTAVHLSWSTFTSSVSTFIHIYFTS